jgi:hypothetical protein
MPDIRKFDKCPAFGARALLTRQAGQTRTSSLKDVRDVRLSGWLDDRALSRTTKAQEEYTPRGGGQALDWPIQFWCGWGGVPSCS